MRLAHYKGLDGKFRLFRYSHWIPAQWREFHELYEFARMRARGSASSSCSAPARSRRRASSLEQVYLNMLLLMRLDSGNFTPDQVEWVREAARGLGADADADADRLPTTPVSSST